MEKSKLNNHVRFTIIYFPFMQNPMHNLDVKHHLCLAGKFVIITINL